MTQKEALKKSYEILSPFSDNQKWEFDNNLVHLRHITRFIGKDAEILDVGCGIGILALALILLGYKVKGLDKYVFIPSNYYHVRDVERLKKIWASYALEVFNTDLLDEESKKTYGMVVSVATIEHQPYPKRFLTKLLEKTKNGGLIYIATPNITNLMNRLRFLLGRSPVTNIKTFFNEGNDFNGHWREYILSELKLMFTELSIEIVCARNTQSMRPDFSLKKMFKVHRSICRFLAYFVPGTGDTNIIIGRKE